MRPSFLDHVDEVEAPDVIAALIEWLTPQTYDVPDPDPKLITALHGLRNELKIRPHDNSPNAISKCLTTLTDELSGMLLEKGAEAEVRARLGDRGELPLGLYEINFDATSFLEAQDRGVRKDHVVDAIRKPDKFQHLTSHAAAVAQCISLFIKDINVGSRKEPSALLVMCTRRQAVLDVVTAYRLFFSDIPNLSQNALAYEWLRAFVDKYGMFFFIGDKGPFKLLDHETFPDHITVGARAENPLNLPIHHIILGRRIPELDVFEVAVGFVINELEYYGDLKRHGIPVANPISRKTGNYWPIIFPK